MADRSPIRIQRKRAKDWRKPDGAVYVGRPTKWGNPFVVGMDNPFIPGRIVFDRMHAFLLYRSHAPHNKALVEAARAELRGKDLMCWCPHDDHYLDACHAAVLLEIANG